MIGCLFCAGAAWGRVTFLTPMPPEQVFVGSCYLYKLFTFHTWKSIKISSFSVLQWMFGQLISSKESV
jgi:hypothetical protein